MPELNFSITDAEPVVHGLSPMLRFRVRVNTRLPTETVQAVLLQSQVHFQPAQRSYSPLERERLSELFGPTTEWGRTLRNRLWAHASTTVSAFTGSIEVRFLVPCTYDMNLAATKYFYALEGDEIPLLFLFSGSIFYLATDGRLQVQPISWDQEAEYRMPVRVWQQALDYHYPNSAWLALRKDVFDRLTAYRRAVGAVTWEQAMESLLKTQTAQLDSASPCGALKSGPSDTTPSQRTPAAVASSSSELATKDESIGGSGPVLGPDATRNAALQELPA